MQHCSTLLFQEVVKGFETSSCKLDIFDIAHGMSENSQVI
jgi:hypothetical protein